MPGIVHGSGIENLRALIHGFLTMKRRRERCYPTKMTDSDDRNEWTGTGSTDVRPRIEKEQLPTAAEIFKEEEGGKEHLVWPGESPLAVDFQNLDVSSSDVERSWCGGKTPYNFWKKIGGVFST